MREIESPYQQPRFGNQPAMLIAGIGKVYLSDPGSGFAQQWNRLRRYTGKIPGQVRHAMYGVLRETYGQTGSEYVCGVEVFERAGVEESMRIGLPDDWVYAEVPEQHYAMFTHEGTVSTIGRTWAHIWNDWLPKSGRKITDGPVVESVEAFDAETRTGIVEIWIPVERR